MVFQNRRIKQSPGHGVDWNDSASLQKGLGLDAQSIRVGQLPKVSRGLTTPGGGVGVEVTSRILEPIVAFASPRHLWRPDELRLSLKGRVSKATVRIVLLYGCEAWPTRVEDVQRHSVFDSRRLRSTADV